jgi:hypothetical protein
MNRSEALRIAKSGRFDGCTVYDLEEIVRLTASKAAAAELRHRFARCGTLMRDERGTITRK